MEDGKQISALLAIWRVRRFACRLLSLPRSRDHRDTKIGHEPTTHGTSPGRTHSFRLPRYSTHIHTTHAQGTRLALAEPRTDACLQLGASASSTSSSLLSSMGADPVLPCACRDEGGPVAALRRRRGSGRQRCRQRGAAASKVFKDPDFFYRTPYVCSSCNFFTDRTATASGYGRCTAVSSLHKLVRMQACAARSSCALLTSLLRFALRQLVSGSSLHGSAAHALAQLLAHTLAHAHAHTFAHTLAHTSARARVIRRRRSEYMASPMIIVDCGDLHASQAAAGRQKHCFGWPGVGSPKTLLEHCSEPTLGRSSVAPAARMAASAIG